MHLHVACNYCTLIYYVNCQLLTSTVKCYSQCTTIKATYTHSHSYVKFRLSIYNVSHRNNNTYLYSNVVHD